MQFEQHVVLAQRETSFDANAGLRELATVVEQVVALVPVPRQDSVSSPRARQCGDEGAQPDALARCFAVPAFSDESVACWRLFRTARVSAPTRTKPDKH